MPTKVMINSELLPLDEGIEHRLPEHLLLSRIIETAIHDLKYKDQEVRSQARAWFFSGNTRPFSFYWCCVELKIGYDKARRQILEYANHLLELENKKKRESLN